MKVLITGGAGFIGLHLARRLLKEGCRVTLLDSLNSQVHGDLPPAVPAGARLIVDDVRNADALRDAMKDVDIVVHLAAETGTGQSMYMPAKYVSVNLVGTAQILDVLVNGDAPCVRKLVVASSRAVYGEGKYRCSRHGAVYPEPRSSRDLECRQFEPRCPVCKMPAAPLATDEASPYKPASLYGLTKQVQEQLVELAARSLGTSVISLRYQNVYGPGQSLGNPYTGILAVFSNLARAGLPVLVFEDGKQSRDFVYIDDVIEGTWRAMQPSVQGNSAINIGAGERITVQHVAQEIAAFFGGSASVEVNGRFRVGDVRHNLADLERARSQLGYAAQVPFSEGLRRFLEWAQDQQAFAAAAYETSLEELSERKLLS